jgi:predicted hydrocarbon binding protein
VAALSRDAWCPFATLMRLDRAIAETVGQGDERVYVELGRASALHRTELLGEHVTLVNVHAYLSRLAEEHRRFHTFGRAEYKRLGFRRGQIAYSEYPELDPVYCLSGLGYLTAAIEQLSGAPARVEEVTCQCKGHRECCFDLRWEER